MRDRQRDHILKVGQHNPVQLGTKMNLTDFEDKRSKITCSKMHLSGEGVEDYLFLIMFESHS